jgi:hypothetical protein
MKKYIALAYFLGFFTCVGCIFAFGKYTEYRIHKMETEYAEQNKKMYETNQNIMKFKNRPPGLAIPPKP